MLWMTIMKNHSLWCWFIVMANNNGVQGTLLTSRNKHMRKGTFLSFTPKEKTAKTRILYLKPRRSGNGMVPGRPWSPTRQRTTEKNWRAARNCLGTAWELLGAARSCWLSMSMALLMSWLTRWGPTNTSVLGPTYTSYNSLIKHSDALRYIKRNTSNHCD